MGNIGSSSCHLVKPNIASVTLFTAQCFCTTNAVLGLHPDAHFVIHTNTGRQDWNKHSQTMQEWTWTFGSHQYSTSFLHSSAFLLGGGSLANNCSLVSDSSKYCFFMRYLCYFTPFLMISLHASLLGPSFLTSTSNLDWSKKWLSRYNFSQRKLVWNENVRNNEIVISPLLS